jgi:hypothetical protein
LISSICTVMNSVGPVFFTVQFAQIAAHDPYLPVGTLKLEICADGVSVVELPPPPPPPPPPLPPLSAPPDANAGAKDTAAAATEASANVVPRTRRLI